jgi:hypothetical protein
VAEINHLIQREHLKALTNKDARKRSKEINRFKEKWAKTKFAVTIQKGDLTIKRWEKELPSREEGER